MAQEGRLFTGDMTVLSVTYDGNTYDWLEDFENVRVAVRTRTQEAVAAMDAYEDPVGRRTGCQITIPVFVTRNSGTKGAELMSLHNQVIALVATLSEDGGGNLDISGNFLVTDNEQEAQNEGGQRHTVTLASKRAFTIAAA